MSKKQFKAECEALEQQGYTMLEYEPENKYAVYKLNGRTRTIGSRK